MEHGLTNQDSFEHDRSMNGRILLCLGALLFSDVGSFLRRNSESSGAGVALHPRRLWLRRYDAQIGRDKNGLFLSALDRNTLAPLTNRPAAPAGVRESDRVGAKDGPLVGSNPYHDENLLRLLLTLSDTLGKAALPCRCGRLRLKWFVANAGRKIATVGALGSVL
jgi:hypothetical protein